MIARQVISLSIYQNLQHSWNEKECVGREVQERENKGISMADSCWCMKEANTILYSNYPSIKNE